MPKNRTEYQIWFAAYLEGSHQSALGAEFKPALTAESLTELVVEVAKLIIKNQFRELQDTWLTDPKQFVILRVEFETSEREVERSTIDW